MGSSEPESLTRRQKQTLPARRALAGKFASPDERSAHFRGLAHRSHERRITLSGDEAVALLHAYALLGTIAERARVKIESNPEEAAGSGTQQTCHPDDRRDLGTQVMGVPGMSGQRDPSFRECQDWLPPEPPSVEGGVSLDARNDRVRRDPGAQGTGMPITPRVLTGARISAVGGRNDTGGARGSDAQAPGGGEQTPELTAEVS